jgi:hypothetical protein
VSYDKLGVDSFGNPAGAMLSRAIGIKSNDCHVINCYSEDTVTQVDYMTNILALTVLRKFEIVSSKMLFDGIPI